MSGVEKPTVVVTHWVHPQVERELARFCVPVMPPGRDVMPRPQVLDRLGRAAGVIVCMADHVDEEFLAAGRGLRVVSATLKGYDNVDVAACTRRGIWLSVLPDQLTAATAELTVALVLGLLRRVGEGDRRVRSGAFHGWRPTLYGDTLAGSTIGVIGMGAVGCAVAERLVPFGAQLLFTDTAGGPAGQVPGIRVELADLLARSAVVLPLVPLTPATYHLLDAEALGLMPVGSYLVNVGRGSVVDEEAVADALVAGHLAGYAADVFAMEDWAVPDHPRAVPTRLLGHPRTLLTPHLGTAVDRVRREMSLVAARQVEQALTGGRPDLAVNQVPA